MQRVNRVNWVRSHAKIVLSWSWNATTACLSRHGWITEPDSGRWPIASRCRSGKLHHVAHGSGATRASLKDLTKATLMRVRPRCGRRTTATSRCRDGARASRSGPRVWVDDAGRWRCTSLSRARLGESCVSVSRARLDARP